MNIGKAFNVQCSFFNVHCSLFICHLFDSLLLFLVGSAGCVVGSEEKRLAVWQRQIASVCTQGSVLGLISVDENLGSRFQRSEEHTSELQSQSNLVCRLLLEKKKQT